jgi:predicted transcriptional regulator
LKSIAYRKTKPVEEILSEPFISVEANATLGEAAEMMIKKKICRLLVTQNDKYIAIITQRDLQKINDRYIQVVAHYVNQMARIITLTFD